MGPKRDSSDKKGQGDTKSEPEKTPPASGKQLIDPNTKIADKSYAEPISTHNINQKNKGTRMTPDTSTPRFDEYYEDYGAEETEWDTNARFFISETGDYINEGGLSEPESSISGTTFMDELPDDDNFREWGPLDPSDSEEQDELNERFFQKFKIKVHEAESELIGENEEEQLPFQIGLNVFLDASHIGIIPPSKFLKVDLSGLRLTSVALVEQFQNLTFLRISKNFIRNVKTLGKLKNLVSIDVSDNEIAKFLDMCSNKPHPLQEANFSKNQITEIVSFQQFLMLTNINLAYNRLKTVSKLQHLYHLRFLNLSHNQITDIDTIDSPNLLVFLVQDNKLQSLSCLRKCRELRYLNANKNKISDLSIVSTLLRLVEIRFAHNNLDVEVNQLESLKYLSYLSHLRLTGNPCENIKFFRQLMIFALPQIRYLNKKIILPEEIVEAFRTFDPSFEKMAFRGHRDAMLDRGMQPAYMMFRDFCQMYPLPQMLFFVASARSQSEILAKHLKHVFQDKVILGGVHSTATTIETGNFNVDIPITLDNFIYMKKRGHFFSTASILGRLCGFSYWQFVKAVENQAALLIGMCIPLEVAICLRKWGFNPKCVLILPSSPPHFNVDELIYRESINTEVEEEPKRREERVISFFEDRNEENLRKDSIKKKRKGTMFNVDENLGETPRRDLIESETEKDVTNEKEANADEIIYKEDVNENPVGKVKEGNNVISEIDSNENEMKEDIGEESELDISQNQLSIFGVTIINPAIIHGIDWKRTVLWSDFYEEVLKLEPDNHFLLTQNKNNPSKPLSAQTIKETLATLGYELVHGPTPVYMKMNDKFHSDPSKLDESMVNNYQLIVVRLATSTTAFEVEASCLEPKYIRDEYVACEDDGGEGGPIINVRPTSPLYRDFYEDFNQAEGDFFEEEDHLKSLEQEPDDSLDNDDFESVTFERRFKHREAMESSINRTRDEYARYHLENPGFFTAVVDPDNKKVNSKEVVENIVKQMFEDSERAANKLKKTSSFPDSYKPFGTPELFSRFVKERLEAIKNFEPKRGYDYPEEHQVVPKSCNFTHVFQRNKCPKNILDTDIPKAQGVTQIYQLQRTASYRKEKVKQELEQACPRRAVKHEYKFIIPSVERVESPIIDCTCIAEDGLTMGEDGLEPHACYCTSNYNKLRLPKFRSYSELSSACKDFPQFNSARESDRQRRNIETELKFFSNICRSSELASDPPCLVPDPLSGSPNPCRQAQSYCPDQWCYPQFW